MKNKKSLFVGKVLSFLALFVICFQMMGTDLDTVLAAEGEARIVVDSFAVTEDAATPGEEFELSVVLKNTSNTYTANNILVSFDTPSRSILPVYGSSNQVYIDSIEAGGSATATFELVVDSKIDVEYLEANISISSYDGFSVTKATNVTTIQVPLKLKSTLVFTYSVPEHTKVGSKARVSATYVNSGMEELSNIQIMITGDGLSRDYSTTLGDLGSGESNIAEIYLDFISEGTQNLYMSFQYTDSDGEIHNTVSQNFIVNVEGSTGNGDDINIVDDTLGLSSMIQLIILGAIVILGIVVAILIRSNRNK